jgi:ubiquinone/menaquinone biosynthesis C-methylase UbiE
MPVNSSAPQSGVIAANVEMYRGLASRYDRCWTSVLGHDLNPALRQDLEKIVSSFSPDQGPFRCLDCGAGTGAVALAMLAHGWSVTAVDVSSEMLELMARKIAARGCTAALVNLSIEEFLSQPGPQYHLIGFHSVLHHIYDYSSVIDLAVDRLIPGGFLYTNVDPVISRHPVLTDTFDSLDTGVAKLLHEPSDFIPGAVRRLRKLTRSADPQFGRKVASVGDIAEFHARAGVNDSAIVRLIRAKGLQIVEHSRYPLARTRVTSYVNRILKLRQEFKIIARSPQVPRSSGSR